MEFENGDDNVQFMENYEGVFISRLACTPTYAFRIWLKPAIVHALIHLSVLLEQPSRKD